MLTSLYTILRGSALSFDFYFHVLFPISLIEAAIELVLINKVSDVKIAEDIKEIEENNRKHKN